MLAARPIPTKEGSTDEPSRFLFYTLPNLPALWFSHPALPYLALLIQSHHTPDVARFSPPPPLLAHLARATTVTRVRDGRQHSRTVFSGAGLGATHPHRPDGGGRRLLWTGPWSPRRDGAVRGARRQGRFAIPGPEPRLRGRRGTHRCILRGPCRTRAKDPDAARTVGWRTARESPPAGHTCHRHPCSRVHGGW